MVLGNKLGRSCRGAERSPDLKIGITFASRQSWGMQPDDKDWEGIDTAWEICYLINVSVLCYCSLHDPKQ